LFFAQQQLDQASQNKQQQPSSAVCCYRALSLISSANLVNLKEKLFEFFGTPEETSLLEEKYRFEARKDAGNLNYGTKTVDFLFERGVKNSKEFNRLKYIGAQFADPEAVTMIITESSSADFDKFLVHSCGFVKFSDHVKQGFQYKTRFGFGIFLYEAQNMDGSLIFNEGVWILEFTIEAQTTSKEEFLSKKQKCLDFFNQTIKPLAGTDLTVVKF
jgi:hypothetical protein